jgi:hypothetical protein
MRSNSSGSGRWLLPLSPVANVLEDLQVFQVQQPREMTFDQSLISFDLPVCPETQTRVGLVLLYQLKACNLKITLSK